MLTARFRDVPPSSELEAKSSLAHPAHDSCAEGCASLLTLASRLNATVFLPTLSSPSAPFPRKSSLSTAYLSDSGSHSTSGISSSASDCHQIPGFLVHTLVTLLDGNRFTQGPTVRYLTAAFLLYLPSAPDLFHTDIPGHIARFRVLSFLPSTTGCHFHLFTGGNALTGRGAEPSKKGRNNDSPKLTTDAIKHKDTGDEEKEDEKQA